MAKPPPEVQTEIAALGSFAAAPFPLRFDRVENRKAVTLRTRDPQAEARAFQKALVNHQERFEEFVDRVKKTIWRGICLRKI